MRKRVFMLLMLSGVMLSAAERSTAFETISGKTAGLRKMDGFVPLYWDSRNGKMWMEITRLDEEFLYISSLPAGVGSNDIGLDRGLMGEPKVVRFERSGPRVLLIESNYSYRVSSDRPAERRAELDSFARSTLWGFDVGAEEGSRLLVDATAFFLRDVVGVMQRLKEAKQGDYKVEVSRCAFYLPFTKAFPKNTDVETTITLVGEPQGEWIRQVTPTPEAVTVREHQSFVQLPDGNYKPRLQDPRAGYFSVDFMDYSAAIDQPVMKHYIARHRLQKKDASAASSEPVEPIVYYVDPGAPDDVRAALMEGASWWNQAFESAGFRNAFQVKVFPTDADPMDVRYNLIQWVHRSTRGWSYGNSLVDPRTGEIIKGIVSLGSLRQHQDYLIFEALLAPHTPGPHSHKALTDAVYARLRQLAAHEVGHTLGLEHNYIASTQNRASVMDYPHPQIDLRDDGSLDLSNAYATGIGAWDKVSIAWGYSQFASGTDERAALDKIITDAAGQGLTFITDADSRPYGSAHPKAHLWDNGPNAVDELIRLLKVRAAALSKFGENNIEMDEPLSTLGDVLVPLYLLHRYQTEAASKVLGGNEYTYALRGDGQPVTSIVPAAEQRRALKVLLQTIDPATLTLPDRILNLIPPRPPAYPKTRESFAALTGLTFDPLAAADAAANLTVGLILNSQRAARLVQYHAQSESNPGLGEILDELVAATWRIKPSPGMAGEVARNVDYVVLNQMIRLALDAAAPTQVRAIAGSKISDLKRFLSSSNDPSVAARDHFALTLIEKFEQDPKQIDLPKPVEAPPGQPIGDEDEW